METTTSMGVMRKTKSLGSARPSLRMLVLSAILWLLMISTVISLYQSNITITNSGVISASKITARSGSANDIQSAVNTVIAAGGGTVYIPEGDWRCDQTSTGAIKINLSTLPNGVWLSIIGSYNNVTALTNAGVNRTMPATILRSLSPTTGNGYYDTFVVTSSVANRHIRISGLAILGYVTSENGANHAINMAWVDGFRIDHCYLDSNAGADIITQGCKGVIDHCGIEQTYSEADPSLWSWGYGITPFGDSQRGQQIPGAGHWIYDLTDVLGRYDWQYAPLRVIDPQNPDYNRSLTSVTKTVPYTAGPVYIEDCWFRSCRHAISAAQYGYYVVRHCTFYEGLSDGMGDVDLHGTGYPSSRACEAYNNVFYGGTAFHIRGAGGVCFNNTFNSTNAYQLDNDGYDPAYPNFPTYLRDLWMWADTKSGGGYYVSHTSEIVPGGNYFTDYPTPTSPAPPRPNYVPLTYPFPLDQYGFPNAT